MPVPVTFIVAPLAMVSEPAPVRTASALQSTTPVDVVLIAPVTLSVPPLMVRWLTEIAEPVTLSCPPLISKLPVPVSVARRPSV